MSLLKSSLFLFVLFCFFTLTVNTYADTVFMENGDKITGKVKTITNGKILLDTPYAGEIKIELSAVGNLRTDANVILKLVNGTEVSGTIDRLEAKQLHILDTTKSLQKLELAQVNSFVAVEENPQPIQPAQQKIVAQTPAQAQPTKPVSFTSSLLADWAGGMDFGFSLTRGNASTSQLTLLANTKKKFGKNSIVINTSSLQGSQNGVQSLNANRFDLRFDRFISDKGFIYLVNEIESNNPKKLKLRHAQGGGFGWQVSNRERLKLSGFGGFGTLRQKFLNTPSTLGVEGRIGEEIVFSPAGKSKIVNKYEMLMNVSESGNYRSQLDMAFHAPLVRNVVFGVRYFNRFDSKPLPNTKGTDSGFITTIGYKFGKK
jgi:putative salt-induced outer membrane protein